MQPVPGDWTISSPAAFHPSPEAGEGPGMGATTHERAANQLRSLACTQTRTPNEWRCGGGQKPIPKRATPMATGGISAPVASAKARPGKSTPP